MQLIVGHIKLCFTPSTNWKLNKLPHQCISSLSSYQASQATLLLTPPLQFSLNLHTLLPFLPSPITYAHAEDKAVRLNIRNISPYVRTYVCTYAYTLGCLEEVCLAGLHH